VSAKRPEAEDLERAAIRIAEALGGDAMLIGGLAVSAWGYIRATDDVDFVTSIPAAEVQKRLEAVGLESRVLRGNVLDGDLAWCVKGTIGGFAFDVIPPPVPVDFDRATTLPLAGGKSVRVVDLETLLRLKLRVGGPQDLLDAAKLLREHPEMLERTRAVARKYGLWTRIESWMKDPRVR
jgi:hypothetical protein